MTVDRRPLSAVEAHKPKGPTYESSAIDEQGAGPHLIVACPTCGIVHEQLAADESEMRRQRREIARLKTELAKQRKTHPNAKQAREVFDHWVRALGKRPSTVFGEKRQKLLLARLEDYTPDDLRAAIDGLARLPFVGPKGRQAAGGPGARKHDELAIVLADETTVDRFIGYSQQSQPESKVSNVVELDARRRPDRDDPWSRPLDRALVALRREFGTDAVEAYWRDGRYEAEEWWSVCPLHPSPLSRPMRIRERGLAGSRLDLVCAEGCLPTMLLERLRGLEQRFETAGHP